MITFAPPATVSRVRASMSARGSRNVGEVIPWSSAQITDTPAGSITRLSRMDLPIVVVIVPPRSCRVWQTGCQGCEPVGTADGCSSPAPPAARLARMRPVLLIGHADWETFGVVPGTLDAEGLPWIEHLAHTGAVLPELSEVSGVVVYGGTMNVDETDEYPFLRDRARVRPRGARGRRPVPRALPRRSDAREGARPPRLHGRRARDRLQRAASHAGGVRGSADVGVLRRRRRLPLARGHVRPAGGRHAARDRRPGADAGVPLRRRGVGDAVPPRGGPGRDRPVAQDRRRRRRPRVGQDARGVGGRDRPTSSTATRNGRGRCSGASGTSSAARPDRSDLARPASRRSTIDRSDLGQRRRRWPA